MTSQSSPCYAPIDYGGACLENLGSSVRPHSQVYSIIRVRIVIIAVVIINIIVIIILVKLYHD